MTTNSQPLRRVAIACGGTGGHLFPGLAVAEELRHRGCALSLLVSEKEVDRLAVQHVTDMEVLSLPAVGLGRGALVAFLRGFARSYRQACKLFRVRPPQAVLAMGGFTSAPPILAGKRFGAATYLHESNTIPGRANRWLARVVDAGFVGFPETAGRLGRLRTAVTGTPVRPQFTPGDPAGLRVRLGLHPGRPVLLVMGGSQGATGINNLLVNSLPVLARRVPLLQAIHLTGSVDFTSVKAAYAGAKVTAVVHEFYSAMEVLLGAADVAVSRAGASSLAELAAMRLPAVLIPYPAAVDDHQFYNARAFEQSGAAIMLDQKTTTPGQFAQTVVDLLQDGVKHGAIGQALAQWHRVDAPCRIADAILRNCSTNLAAVEDSGEAKAESARTLRSQRGSSRARDCILAA